MATVNINGTIRQFDHIEMFFDWGGGTDEHKVNHWIDDSLSIEEGGYTRHDHDMNGSEIVTRRREGRPQLSMVKFSVKRSDLIGADDLHDRMLAEAGVDGFVPEFSFYLIGYDSRRATTGEKVLFDNCIFEGGFSTTQGSQHDPVPVSIISHQPKATMSEVS